MRESVYLFFAWQKRDKKMHLSKRTQGSDLINRSEALYLQSD